VSTTKPRRPPCYTDLASFLNNLADQVPPEDQWEAAARAYDHSLETRRDGPAAELLRRAAWPLGHHRLDPGTRAPCAMADTGLGLVRGHHLDMPAAPKLIVLNVCASVTTSRSARGELRQEVLDCAANDLPPQRWPTRDMRRSLTG
jgi:hypothetical protein